MCEHNVQMLLETTRRGKGTNSEKTLTMHEMTTVERVNDLAIHHRETEKDGERVRPPDRLTGKTSREQGLYQTPSAWKIA